MAQVDSPTGVGIIIGRFQVAELTRGHDELLQRVGRRHNKVVVLLGVNAKLTTKENPLGYESRERLLMDHWSDTLGKNTNKTLIVAPLPDRATDDLWSKQIDALLDSLLGPMTPRTLYGGRDSCMDHYLGRIEKGDIRTDGEITEDTGFDAPGSATEQRAELFEKPPMTEEGRAGAIWAAGNKWNRIDPCVDMAVTYEEGNGAGDRVFLLMGKKLGGVGKYCFPGGHVDGTDVSAEFAATREILEETGLDIKIASWNYICQVPVNDWRNTSTCQTWSTLFHVMVDEEDAKAKAADDLDEVHWVDMQLVAYEEISPTHLPMFLKLKANFGFDKECPEGTGGEVELTEGEGDNEE